MAGAASRSHGTVFASPPSGFLLAAAAFPAGLCAGLHAPPKPANTVVITPLKPPSGTFHHQWFLPWGERYRGNIRSYAIPGGHCLREPRTKLDAGNEESCAPFPQVFRMRALTERFHLHLYEVHAQQENFKWHFLNVNGQCVQLPSLSPQDYTAS